MSGKEVLTKALAKKLSEKVRVVQAVKVQVSICFVISVLYFANNGLFVGDRTLKMLLNHLFSHPFKPETNVKPPRRNLKVLKCQSNRKNQFPAQRSENLLK